MQQFSTAQQLTISRSKWKGKEQDARNLPNTNTTVLASRKEREDAFKEDVAAVDTLIHNLAANLRVDGGINSKEAREMERLKKEREEARLRQVAEERAARQKEAEARDPHKKVHLKLENTRKFGKDFLEELRVPMQQVDFVTEAGVDHVNMVDILQIRQRCKRCDTRATPSVDTLIQDQTRSDALRGLDPKTGKPLALPAGSSHSAKGEAATTKKSQSGSSSKLATAGRTSISGGRAERPSVVMDEVKQARIASNISQAHVKAMLRKLNSMRSEPTEATLYNLEQMANHAQRELALQMMLETEESNTETQTRDTRKGVGVTYSNAKTTSFGQLDMLLEDEAEESPPPLLHRAQTESLVSAVRGSRKAKSLPVRINQQKRKAQRECDPKVHGGALRGLQIMRYVVSCRVLWGIVQKKRNAIQKVKTIAYAIGEWTRLRHGMATLMGNIKVLQRGARQFLALKRKRCEIMSKEWQQIEDKHLEKYFKHLAEKTIKEEALRAAELKAGAEGKGTIKHKMAIAKASTDSKQNMINKLMKENIDWKMYRIPPKERRTVLSRYYMAQLRKKVLDCQHIMRVVSDLVQFHKNTLGFLKEFGADEGTAQDLKSLATAQKKGHRPAEFWQINEDICLDLIAFAAHGMPDADPWRSHPAMREINGMDNPMFRHYVKASASQKDIFGRMGEQRPLSPQKRAASNNAPAGQKEEKKADARIDIDELWQNFTPRLRESANQPPSRASERPSSRPGLGDQDQAAWHSDVLHVH